MGQIKKTGKCLDANSTFGLENNKPVNFFACADGNWFAFSRARSRKNLKMAKVYKRVKSLPEESFRKKLEMAKDSRVKASSRRSENSTVLF